MGVVVSPAIFRAYDIRGIVDRELTVAVYEVLGRAAGAYFQRSQRRRIVVAHDARLTSPSFAAGLVRGLRASGCDVIDIGMAPTPLMYFAVSYLGADGGAVVTASHNPPEFNGLKLRQSDPVYGGEPLSSQELRQVAALALGDLPPDAAVVGGYEQRDMTAAYIADVVTHFRLARPVRVVLDGGNGVAGPLGLRTLEAIGCEVVPLYIEPDGHFPNHHPDPLKEENLRDLKAHVRAVGAELGVSLDGDGDRLGVVDGSGAMVFADRTMIVLARDALANGPAPIVFDVKCSTVLRDAIRASGGTPVMWKTGYTNGSQKMRELGAPLAGELSGHIFARLPHHHCDDGTFAACWLLAALERSGQSLVEALAPYPPLPSVPEDRLEYPEDRKFAAVDYVRDRLSPHYEVTRIDGVRIDFPDGWGLIRASNTESVITTRFEAHTPERVAEIRALIIDALTEFRR
jgi:phosphomannomutase